MSIAFIVYTNDLPNCLRTAKPYYLLMAQLYQIHSDIKQLYSSINSELDSMTEWFLPNKLSLNVGKTHIFVLVIDKCKPIKLANRAIEKKQFVKFLGKS